ncbi:hypothetical protein AVEN_114589-1, partial [Araneus ventricosus]
ALTKPETSENMENEPPQEVSVPQISSPPSSKRPVLRKYDREVCEAWLIRNLLQDLTPKKGSQMPMKGDVLRYFVFLNRGPMWKDKRDDVIKFVTLKVKQFWKHSGIPVKPMIARHSKAKTQEINCAIQNLPKHETSKNFPAEIERLLESLLLIFDIAHDNAISITENDRCRTRKTILEDVQFLEDQRSCRKMELGGLDKTHFAKKRRQEKASTKINISTSLELDEVGSLDSRDSDSLDADADTEPYSLEDPDFIFPSTSSGATGSKRLRSKNPSPSIALKLPRNPFTSKIVSNIGDRLNLSAGQRTAFMGAIITEVGIPIEKATFSV